MVTKIVLAAVLATAGITTLQGQANAYSADASASLELGYLPTIDGSGTSVGFISATTRDNQFTWNTADSNTNPMALNFSNRSYSITGPQNAAGFNTDLYVNGGTGSATGASNGTSAGSTASNVAIGGSANAYDIQTCTVYYSQCTAAQTVNTSASATASASLNNWSMHATATTTPGIHYVDAGGGALLVGSTVHTVEASLNDQLTFHVPAQDADKNVYMDFTLNIDGNSNATGQAGLVSLQVCDDYTCPPTAGYAIGGGAVDTAISVLSMIHAAGQIDDTVNINTTLLLEAGRCDEPDSCPGQIVDGVDVDYGDTAYLTFDPPEGVTFTSASGVALTVPYVETNVPEPPALWLWLGGMAGLLAVRCHTRRRVHVLPV